MSKLYVGNLPWSATEQDLKQFFSSFTVTQVRLITDRETNKPRGFGFVTIQEDARGAISALDGTELGGRKIKVNEAAEKSGGNKPAHTPRSKFENRPQRKNGGDWDLI